MVLFLGYLGKEVILPCIVIMIDDKTLKKSLQEWIKVKISKIYEGKVQVSVEFVESCSCNRNR